MIKKLKELKELNGFYLGLPESWATDEEIREIYKSSPVEKKKNYTCFICNAKTKDRKKNYLESGTANCRIRYLLCRYCIKVMNNARRRIKQHKKMTDEQEDASLESLVNDGIDSK